jgi:hypothetical protein
LPSECSTYITFTSEDLVHECFSIVEYITGAALTSWPAQPGDTNNPVCPAEVEFEPTGLFFNSPQVTFETFDQRVQQNWTIIPLASLD